MTLQKIEVNTPYSIENPGFRGLAFTKSSESNLNLPKMVEYCKNLGTVMQSLDEAAAFRIEADGEDHANAYQRGRTGAIHFLADGQKYAAFDDIWTPDKNLVVVHAQAMYDAHKAGRPFVLPTSDALVKAALRRAEKTGRVVEFTESPLELSTKSVDGVSAFGSNKTVRAMLPTTSEAYAGWLNKEKGYETGYVHDLKPGDVKHLGKDQAELRLACLGGDDYYGLYVLYAYERADNDYVSRVRGVRREAAAPLHRKRR